ncbi:glycosyltransferase [Peribacillus frigoritolerans]|uniref:glycosyltransferase n=1 Tax=Peribacillus frigoritolerans TaxID=450367 RepID=UPI00343F519B
MPVYNQDPNYLREALLSILNQTYTNFHSVIVIDGADQPTRNVIYELIKNDPELES